MKFKYELKREKNSVKLGTSTPFNENETCGTKHLELRNNLILSCHNICFFRTKTEDDFVFMSQRNWISLFAKRSLDMAKKAHIWQKKAHI